MSSQNNRQSADRKQMELAIEEMRRSSGRGPRVGAVIASDGHVISRGCRSVGLHAERDAIEKALAAGVDLRGSTIYTTLEPCVSLGGKTESCADLIVRNGIAAAVIGRYDTNPRIYREGWKKLRDGGVHLRDFDADLRSQIDDLNAEFVDHFMSGVGPIGGAQFDYELNEGNFSVQFSDSDERSIVTNWTRCGRDSIYAYASRPLRVALAKNASEFREIDDPTALDFDYCAKIKTGEIAVFVSDSGAVLVKVVEVHSGPDYGSNHTSVKIQYQVRPQ